MDKTSKRPAAAPPHSQQQQQQAAAAATTSVTPPAPFVLLLKLMMLTGVLDAFDLTVIARCSREARDAVARFWEGLGASNPATRLCSVERLVEDSALNKTGFGEYVPVSQAAACVVCGTRTRHRQPVGGSMLCAPCGTEVTGAGPEKNSVKMPPENVKML